MPTSNARPTSPPDRLTAGESLCWDFSSSDYPASTWTLTVFLRGPAKHTLTVTADGDTHQIDATAAATAEWPAGEYEIYGRATKGTEAQPIFDRENSPRITIEEDLATSTSAYEARTRNEIIRDHLLDVIEGRVARSESEYSISFAGHTQNVSLMGPEELTAALTFFEGRVLMEKQKRDVAAGKPSGRTIRTRFRS